MRSPSGTSSRSAQSHRMTSVPANTAIPDSPWIGVFRYVAAQTQRQVHENDHAQAIDERHQGIDAEHQQHCADARTGGCCEQHREGDARGQRREPAAVVADGRGRPAAGERGTGARRPARRANPIPKTPPRRWRLGDRRCPRAVSGAVSGRFPTREGRRCSSCAAHRAAAAKGRATRAAARAGRHSASRCRRPRPPTPARGSTVRIPRRRIPRPLPDHVAAHFARAGS